MGTLRRYPLREVKRPASFSLPRAIVAMAMMFSWFVLSNHCALALMLASTTPAEHAGCCGKDEAKGGGDAPGPLVRECCQFLQALTPAPSVVAPPITWVALAPTVVVLDFEQTETVPPVREISQLETGPPEARSFVELVLQQGLRSHAPPTRA